MSRQLRRFVLPNGIDRSQINWATEWQKKMARNQHHNGWFLASSNHHNLCQLISTLFLNFEFRVVANRRQRLLCASTTDSNRRSVPRTSLWYYTIALLTNHEAIPWTTNTKKEKKRNETKRFLDESKAKKKCDEKQIYDNFTTIWIEIVHTRRACVRRVTPRVNAMKCSAFFAFGVDEPSTRDNFDYSERVFECFGNIYTEIER